MNFRRQNKQRPFIVWFVIIGIAGIVVVGNVLSNGGVRSVVSNVASPLFAFSNRAYDAYGHLPLRDSNDELLKRLRIENQLFKIENAALRHLPHDTKSQAYPVMRVVSHAGVAVYGTLLIERNTLSKEEAMGALVLADAGFAIGRVSAVDAYTMQVTLFSSPRASIDTLLVTEDGASMPVTLLSASHGNFSTRIPRDSAVITGTLASAPSANGYPVAITGKIESKTTDPYATLYLTVPFSLETVRFVEIVPTPL